MEYVYVSIYTYYFKKKTAYKVGKKKRYGIGEWLERRVWDRFDQNKLFLSMNIPYNTLEVHLLVVICVASTESHGC